MQKNNISVWCSALLAGVCWFSSISAPGAEAKSYQVTGPVLEVTPTTVVVQKGDEKWEVARTKSTKITGDLKVGSKVTVYYQMVAQEMEVKGDAAADKKDKKPKK